ncbi:MAG: PAS domain S-box protein, partial [Anaerolineales bacterium]|nr:PAS domain S-box protein [Anaerolineales bacterium]
AIYLWPNPSDQVTPLSTTSIHTLQSLGFSSFACAPLLHHDQILGVFYLFDQQSPQIVHITERLIAAIGRQVGTAVANAYLHEDIAFKQNQLQTLIDASHNGVIFITPEGNVPLINAAAFEMLGLSGQTHDWLNGTVTQNLLRLRRLNPELIKNLIRTSHHIHKETQTDSEFEIELANRVLHWSNVPVRDNGQYQGRLLIAIDVTEERRVAQMREDLTQTMVHDLRNPLTSITGAIEMLNFEVTNNHLEDISQMLGVIDLNANKMLNLVNTIMDMNPLESRQLPLRQAVFRLIDLIVEAFKRQAPLAEEKELQLQHNISPQLPLVWADADLIARVLQNLIGNAIQFSPTGQSIEISAEVKPQTD